MCTFLVWPPLPTSPRFAGNISLSWRFLASFLATINAFQELPNGVLNDEVAVSIQLAVVFLWFGNRSQEVVCPVFGNIAFEKAFFVDSVQLGPVPFCFVLHIQVSNPIRTRCCIFPASSKGFVEFCLCEFIVGATLCKCSVETTQYGCVSCSVVWIAQVKLDFSLRLSVALPCQCLMSLRLFWYDRVHSLPFAGRTASPWARYRNPSSRGFLETMLFSSQRYQSRGHRRLPNLNVPYFECHWMRVQLRHICQPQTWSHQDSQALCILDGYLPFGVASPGFQPGLAARKNSLSSMPPSFLFTVCKPWPSAREMVLVALTAEYQECLKSWPFRCALSMHLCMVALWLFNKDEVCWHILLTSITYLPLQRRCMECSSFITFP